MRKKHRNRKLSLAAYIVAIITMMAALVFCFSVLDGINQRMNDSATSNLLNTTKVIEGTLETYINKDFESLNVIGEFYKNESYLDEGEVQTLRDTMGFEWVGIVDEYEEGVDCFDDRLNASDIPCYDEWQPGEKGYSDAYMGESGRQQTMMWIPLYDNDKYMGTVFGSVILSKYYSDSVFTFYEGAGRTYLFDGEDGKWILRSLGTDGVSQRVIDIYSLLLDSGNTEKEIQGFRQAVEDRKAGTVVYDFNGEESYVCFLPLSSSADWYIVTVIAKDVLLKESSQVQRMIQMILIIFCITFIISTVTFAIWQIRRTKAKEADYREALFANVSSNIDSAFLIYDKKRQTVVFVSDNVKRLLGLDRNCLQKDVDSLFDWCNIPREDEQRIAFLKGTLSEPVVREVCVKNKAGTVSNYIRLELIPADLEQEIAVLTDITKEKDIQRSLMEAMEQAEAASHAKNDFLSSMSHDIRTPMNGIVGMTAIAQANIRDRERVRDCLNKISEASAHLLTLINEVLDMSQFESGKIELSSEAFNLAELLQDELDINDSAIQKKNHLMKVYIHSMEHEEVIGDPVKLRRVISNLVTNAIKYTQDKGNIIVELREKDQTVKGYGCYELTVQDNGIGMSREFQKKLFEPFEREEGVRNSRIQGTGLGMSIVKKIVALMMGDIHVESEKNRGTTFRVTMNLQLNEKANETGKKLSRRPVLVVDDDIDACRLIAEMLSDMGMIGEWAKSADEAMRRIKERRKRGSEYLAVLLELQMPSIDGVETARWILEETTVSCPIIILMAYDRNRVEKAAKMEGIDGFLTKPVYKAKLREQMLKFVYGYTEIPEISVQDKTHIISSGYKILLAEDNELNREIAIEFLKMEGVEVDCVENGIEAVEHFADSEPGTYDMILMDIQMPEMDGYEATRTIRSMERADSRAVPIVAMTANAFAKDIQAAHAAGMNEHIAKPISVEKIRQVLTCFLVRTVKNLDWEEDDEDKEKN